MKEFPISPNILPVYLSVQNPLILTEDQEDIIEDIKYHDNIYQGVFNKGYDGVISHDMEQVFVFNRNQIKSSIGNNGKYDINDTSINK